MYYLIQKNVFQDPRYDEVFRVLNDLHLPYEVVEFKPQSNDFFFKTNRKDVFVYGSVKLAKEATKFNWQPGSFYGKNHKFEAYSLGYGNNCINFDSNICEFISELNWSNNEQFFIKPSRDAKVFTGKIFTKSEWEDFVFYSLKNSTDKRITKSTLIQVSKPHQLIKEARVWIVNKKIATSSYYQFHGNIDYEENLCLPGLEFAQEMADLYNVANAYVMDICLTYDGWKIMEINCINSSGFYKANVKDIVLELEKMYN